MLRFTFNYVKTLDARALSECVIVAVCSGREGGVLKRPFTSYSCLKP